VAVRKSAAGAGMQTKEGTQMQSQASEADTGRKTGWQRHAGRGKQAGRDRQACRGRLGEAGAEI
jgi:hypothetical protein